MSDHPVSLGNINTKVEIITASKTNEPIPTGAVFAEVLLIGGGGGGGAGTASVYGSGGGEGAKGWYRFPVIAGNTYSCTAPGSGGAAAGDGGDTTFTIINPYSNTVLTANNGVKGTSTTGGDGGAADTQTKLLFQSVAGDKGATGGGGGGTGGGVGGPGTYGSDASAPGIANTGGGGGGGMKSTAGKAGGLGYIQITWYFNTNSNVKLSEVDSQSYLFTSPLTSYNLPAPLGAQAADVILIGGGGSGGSYTATNGGSGGGQGVISYSPIVIPQGSVSEIVEVKTTNTTTNPWYASPATWEKNAPTLGNGVYWIYATTGGNLNAAAGAYFVFYGIYNNTSTSSTSAYLSFGADDYGYVILNGSVVINWAYGGSGFSNPSITLLPGKNTFIATIINTGGGTAIWLAATSSSAGGGTVYYKTDNTWKWTMMYGISVGAGATTAATKGGDTIFTLNTMADTTTEGLPVPNITILTQFIAGGGVGGTNSSTSATNSGTATIKQNTATVGTASTPSDRNTNTTGNGMIMYVSGAKGAAGSSGTGGAGGSFINGTRGDASVAPTAGQTNGGGGGGGAGSKSGSTTGANGGNGLALVTFYGGSSSLPISLYAVSTRTDIYTTGSGSSISIPTGAYILKLILIGGGGNGAAWSSPFGNFFGNSGGSGALGMWIIPVANIGSTYSYQVGSPGTNTTFTLNATSTTFTAATGANGVDAAGGEGGAAPTSPDNAVKMVQSLAGINGIDGSTSGGGGLYGGAGNFYGNGVNGGVGSGGGGTRAIYTGGTGGKGMIVATWYYKNPNISLTNYTNGPYVS